MYDRLVALGNFEHDLLELKDMRGGNEELVARAVERAGLRIALAIAAPDRLVPHS
jgi:hypothetical protein